MTQDNYLKKELYNLIKEDESIFDFIQESSLDGLWYWDIEKPENEWMNARFWTTLGYNPDEMPHLSSAWQDIINQDDLKLALDNFSKHLENSNHPYDQIVRYTHKNSSIVWIRCRGMAIRNEKGKPIRMLGAHQNITDLKESNETKDKFFSIIAHDLKSPFSALLGLTGLLLKNHKNYDEEKREELITSVNNSANIAFKLLENLLIWSHSQSGLISYSPEKLNLKILLSETMYALQAQADQKEIKILDAISENETIIADKNMIATVFRNLISNAIKFTSKNGNIVISSEKQQDSNFREISVTDTGLGIPEDKIDNLFRIDKNTSTKGTENETGTGLGLILCKEFVEKHGGKIWVESEIDKGSTFYIALPCKTSNNN